MQRIFTKGEINLRVEIFSLYHDDEDSRFKDNDENDVRDNSGLIDYKKLNRLINLKRRNTPSFQSTSTFLYNC